MGMNRRTFVAAGLAVTLMPRGAMADMSDQEKLFQLLKPERIGCVLTENWQIDPEQSTSAVVVHHPEAKYFNV